MFGFVNANMGELTQAQKDRYSAVYCGICRSIARRWGQLPRLTLQYDGVFLALLLMSLYEPEEHSGKGRCLAHPLRKRDWVDSGIIDYCADMNVALAYWKCMDDWNDDRKAGAKWLAGQLEAPCAAIAQRYPRQWKAMEESIQELARLERLGCPELDRNGGCFGALMSALLTPYEDQWSRMLGSVGFHLGKFIYFMDAAVDLSRDAKKGSYNPWLTCGGFTQKQIEDTLVNILGSCTKWYEALPLVQDKALLDNILYSGVWVQYRRTWKETVTDGPL